MHVQKKKNRRLGFTYCIQALNLTVKGADIGLQTVGDEVAQLTASVFDTNLCKKMGIFPTVSSSHAVCKMD